MKQNYWDKKPSSFAETVQLVESYVRAEIQQETKAKQLVYHTLDHALAVKRRASTIFRAIRPVLSQDISADELKRLESLLNLSALAHDMVQLFDSSTLVNQPRKRLSGLSEIETANKLLRYIQNLNQELAAYDLDSAILFSDRDQQIIKDAIIATVCQNEPKADKADNTFSAFSIYQPYLYESRPKISIIGSIIALADLGTLGMDGIEKYIHDGILVFLEDNPNYQDLLVDGNSQINSRIYELGDCSKFSTGNVIKTRLLDMARFMVGFAHERRARFELEISGFPPPVRQILREKVFIYLSPENIKEIEAVLPTHESASLEELIDFFCLQ